MIFFHLVVDPKVKVLLLAIAKILKQRNAHCICFCSARRDRFTSSRWMERTMRSAFCGSCNRALVAVLILKPRCSGNST